MNVRTESRIRPARPAEAGHLTALAMRSKAHWGYTPEFMAACRDELSVTAADITSGPVEYFVLETDREQSSELVGFYGVEPGASRQYQLDALFVEPAYIGAGIGRRLVHHALETTRAAGGRTLIVQGDPNAEGFYRAVGGRYAGHSESLSIAGRFLPVFEFPVSASPTGIAQSVKNSESVPEACE